MKKIKFKVLRLYSIIKELLDLRSDFDEGGTYSLVSGGAEFRSGNAWGLIFAIFIASIGLNVNSTAVIIGAMLISPLMGSIVGAGYALGTHDFELLKKSITNLLYAVAISIVTSTLFFLISPSAATTSELLARTQPTFYDVLIAFFGGAAGIVANTRRIKGNAVPGVAIATALMPPLCTVGFGLAHFEFSYVVGALYLFSINAIFILISTYLFVRFLGFKLKKDRNPRRDRVIHRYMTWGSFVFIIPSIIMAWYLHKKTQFENNVADFISSEFNLPNTMIAKKEAVFDWSAPRIKIQIFGDEITKEQREIIESHLANYSGLSGVSLSITNLMPENFSLEDLAEKFVKRSELSQMVKLELYRKMTSEQEKSNSIILSLRPIVGDSVESVEVRDSQVKIVWKRKLNKVKLEEAERAAYKALIGTDTEFFHSVAIE
ncbi:MAG: hypothetical protein RJB66_14 [Pseudomonadota bacterium]